MISEVGLVLITAGWMLQLAKVWKGEKKIQQNFVVTYAAGVLLLVVDGYASGLFSLALLNFLCLLAAIAMIVKLK